MTKGLNKLEQCRQALVYLRIRRDNLEDVVESLMEAYKQTGEAFMLVQQARVELKQVEDAIYHIERQEDWINKNDKENPAPISGPGNVEGHKKLKEESTFERRKNPNPE